MDFLNEEGLLWKAKSMVSSLLETMLWTTTLSSPMQIRKEWPTQPPGLKTIIYSQGEQPQNTTHHHHHPYFILHSCMIIPSSSPAQSPSFSSSSSLFQSLTHSSSYSSWSSMLDDWIGTESGVYMNSDEEDIRGMEKPESCHYNVGKRSHHRCATSKRKYPPPIPLLARTGDLPGHMPWVLTRHYSNGKLILIEERVKHHDYFEAYREDGRLILNLVPLDDKVRCCHSIYKKEEELQPQDFVNAGLIEEEKGNKIQGNSDEEEEEEEEEELEEEEVDENGGCYDYDLEEEVAMHENMVTGGSASSSLPKLCNLNNGGSSGRCGDVHKCFTHAGRMISDDIILNSWNINASGGYVISQSPSADHPLAFSLRPMASVAS